MEISRLFAGRDADIRAMQTRLIKVAEMEGLPFSVKPYIYNSRMAQELGIWAETIGHGESFHKAVYLAYFSEGRNIALTDELLVIAGSAGLPVSEARTVIEERRFATAVDTAWQRAREMRITAVPAYICEERRMSGFGPYDNFLRLTGRS